MVRGYNSDRGGAPFSEQIKQTIWNKAQIVAHYDSSKIRKDGCGAWIEWSKYGDTTENGYGWEIDHIKPISKGGTDDLDNLQPLQWQNNRKKSDSYPASGYCTVVAK